MSSLPLPSSQVGDNINTDDETVLKSRLDGLLEKYLLLLNEYTVTRRKLNETLSSVSSTSSVDQDPGLAHP